MAGKTTLPGGEYLPRMGAVIVPLIEEYMSQAGTDDGGDTYIDEQDAEPAFGGPLAFEHLGYDIESYPEAYSEHKTVPAHGDEAAEDVGINIPGDE